MVILSSQKKDILRYQLRMLVLNIEFHAPPEVVIGAVHSIDVHAKLNELFSPEVLIHLLRDDLVDNTSCPQS